MKKHVLYLFSLVCFIGFISLSACSKNDEPESTPVTCDDFTVGIAALDSMLVATSSNGTDPLTYSWSTGQTGNAIFPDAAGTYSVTVTDAEGCVADNSFDLQVLCDFRVNYIMQVETSPGNYDLIPNLDDGTAPFTYLWSTGELTTTISVSTMEDATTYSVTVTDANNCQESQTTTVSGTCSNFSTNIALIQDSISVGDVYLYAWVNGGTAPYSWLWSTGETENDIVPNGLGVYSVTVTDADGCETVDIYDLDVICTLDVTGITMNETSADNYDLTAELDYGVAPFSYSWSLGETTATISVSASAGDKIYGVTVTDADGCTDNDQVTIPGSDPCFTFSTEIYLVQDSITIGDDYLYTLINGGVSPFTWEWSTSEIGSNIQVTTAGTYSVTVTDENGCTAVDAYDY